MISYPITLSNGIHSRVIEGTRSEVTEHIDAMNAPLILLVHGLGARADRWTRNVDSLAELGWRVVAVDLPGHGFAAKGMHAPHTIPALRDFVLHVLDEFGVTEDYPAALVGTSLGGHVCAEVAINSPHLCSHLGLIGTLGLRPLGEEARRALGTRCRLVGRDDIAAKLSGLVADDTLVTPTWRAEEFMINNSVGAKAYFDAIGDYIIESLDDDLVGPSLVESTPSVKKALFWGRHDSAFPVEIGESYHLATGIPINIFEGSAHAPYLEEPEAFAIAMRNFLSHDSSNY